MEYPKNWQLKSLEDVLEVITNGSNLEQFEEQFEGSSPISRIETIANETIDFERVKYVNAFKSELEKYSLHFGDILFSHINSDKHLGKTAIYTEDRTLVHGINLLLIRTNKNCNSFFLNYLFKYYRATGVFMGLAQRAVNQSSINQKKLKSLVVPLPPLSEQQRLVAKLDALFGSLEQLKSRLNTIPQLLKTFRQAVLTQAVTGKLTREWREGKELEKIDLVKLEVLREQIKREDSIKRGFKSYKHKNAVLPDLGGFSKGIDELFELPESWQWVSLDQVVWNVSDGPHFSPQYVTEKEGIRFISMRNVSFNGIDFSDCKHVSLEDHNEFIKRGKPEVDDILYTKGGTTGIPCVVSENEEFSYWVHVALLKPIKKFTNSYFLRNTLASQLCYKQSQELTHGVGNQDLGLTRMIYITFPLPPLSEQHEIVRRVEGLLSKADAIEARYRALKGQVDALPQAVLGKAFRGEWR